MAIFDESQSKIGVGEEISFLPVLDIGTGVGLINTLDVLDLAAEEYPEVYGEIIVPKDIAS